MTNVPDPPAPAGSPPALERLRIREAPADATLAALYDQYRSEVLAFLIGFTRDREGAEDLLQDTFIRLIREARAGRMPDDVRPWLYRVATNSAISRGRRGAVLHRLLPRLADRREPVRPEGEALRSERNKELDAAMAQLPADDRAALLLAAQGFTGHEIAALTGRSEGATRTRMCRSRVELRRILEAPEGEL